MSYQANPAPVAGLDEVARKIRDRFNEKKESCRSGRIGRVKSLMERYLVANVDHILACIDVTPHDDIIMRTNLDFDECKIPPDELLEIESVLFNALKLRVAISYKQREVLLRISAA